MIPTRRGHGWLQPSLNPFNHPGDEISPSADIERQLAASSANWQRILASPLLPNALSVHRQQLHGLPYPIAYRNQGIVEGWRRAMHTTKWGQLEWHSYEAEDSPAAYCFVPLTVQILKSYSLAPEMKGVPAAGVMLENMAMQVGFNISFECKRGTLIESTAALETQLVHSDLDATLTMGMLAPPFAAQYVCFGAEAAKVLRWPDSQGGGVIYDGVFFFFSQPAKASGKAHQPTLELVFIGKNGADRFAEYRLLRAPVGSGDETIVEWIDSALERNDGGKRGEKERMRLLEAVNFLVKLLLYMDLKDARLVRETPHTRALVQLERIGPKKRAKAIRHLDARYDRITVGPAAWPGMNAGHADGDGVMPHWRRGHFRMQIHGPGRQQRKLIFVAPVMVRADKLGAELPRPKTYRATL